MNMDLQLTILDRVITKWPTYKQLNGRLQQVSCNYIVGYPMFFKTDLTDNFVRAPSTNNLSDEEIINTLNEVFKNRRETSYIVSTDGTLVYGLSDAYTILMHLSTADIAHDIVETFKNQLYQLLEKNDN